MKLIFIRHGDPDYSIDSLTEKGWREAELLSDRIAPLNVKAYFVSPLGRAKDTASFTLKKAKRTAETCDWLREFDARIIEANTGREKIVWDWLPEDWTKCPEYYDKDLWFTTDIMTKGSVREKAQAVYDGIDKILADNGYVHNGAVFDAVNPNNDTIVFFCHFGVECLILGYLTGISPMILWHNFCALTTSVTTVITEERRKGTASFRVNGFGDLSHLYAAGEPAAFAARFCECYDNEDERHD